MVDSGWYPDPEREGMARYWDGAAWTEHRHRLPEPPPPPSPFAKSRAVSRYVPSAPSAPPAPPPPPPAPPPAAAPAYGTEWYLQPIVVGALLVFCFPVGLVLVWRTEWQRTTKLLVTVVTAVVVLLIATDRSPPEPGVELIGADAVSATIGGSSMEREAVR